MESRKIQSIKGYPETGKYLSSVCVWQMEHALNCKRRNLFYKNNDFSQGVEK